jgi:outer membrane protein OmpA-like peptidoglycan-associated protein
MKKFSLLILLILSITLLHGQNADKKWAIGIGGGYFHNLDVTDNDVATKIYFSRYLSPSFDIRLKNTIGFFINNPEAETSLDNINLLLDLRYKFYNGKMLPADNKIQPFLFAGAGYLFDNAKQGVNFDAGLGVKYLLKPNVALFAEVGYVNGIDAFRLDEQNIEMDVHDNFIKALVGIEIAFGKSPDADGDGVPDSKDKCPGTPKKAKVDKEGCPIDTDGDGIYDGIDKCPEEKGIAARQGCPFKEDEVIWLKIKVKSIFFDTSMSDITDDSKDRMKELVDLMLENPDYHVNVFGMADPRGDAQANLELSGRRAQAAASYLVSKGISRNRITSEALGEQHSNKESLTEEELQNARRVDFTLYK